MRIRPETAADHAAVRALLDEAFEGGGESALVERLRAGKLDRVALVAVAHGAVSGHAMLSPMRAPFPALGLAPLAVAAGCRGKGIGAALVAAALDRARTDGAGWRAVFVLGDPAYYGRFGFRADLAAGFATPYAESHFMVLPLAGTLPVRSGPVAYAPPFDLL